jgi:hypothetical protein
MGVAVLLVGADSSRAQDSGIPDSLFEEEEAQPKRFIQWPRVTIGLVWTDPANGQMKVMDLGSAPENGAFTPDVLMSRCMRAAARLSPEGLNSDSMSGTSTRNLRPMSEEEILSMIQENASRLRR